MRLTTYDTPVKAWEMAFTERREADAAISKEKTYRRASVHCANLGSGTDGAGTGPRLATAGEDYGPRDVYDVTSDYWRE